MEKISINGSKEKYEILSIVPMSEHMLKIEFSDQVPDVYGDIQVYTAGDVQCANLPGYGTIYRDEGKTVYLSNDGSVYAPLDPGEVIPPDPYIPTLEELAAAKKQEINEACTSAIVGGITVVLSDGRAEHFDLKEEDQLAMLLSATEVAAGTERIPWHPNSDKTMPCVFYSNADMAIITNAAKFHISYHQTYSNSLKVWVESCQTAEEVQAISYGAEVPEEYRSEVLQAYIAQTNGPEEDTSETSTVE